MIITPERLIDLAKEEVARRADRQSLVAGYLVGSVIHGDPLLGGCADIDLIIIHPTTPLRPHEIKRLSREVHLEIFHKPKSEFDNPRELRVDPGLGLSLCGSLRLYDPEHFFDWAQASACAKVFRPEYRLARARHLLGRARSSRAELTPGPHWPIRFVQAAWDGANSLCCLNDRPVAGRAAALKLKVQLDQLEAAYLYAQFLELCQLAQMDQWNVPAWLTSFGKAFDLPGQLSQGEEFKPVRRDYYLKAFQALAEQGRPEAAVLGMLTHWPLPATSHEPLVQEITDAEAWQSMLEATGLTHGAFEAKRMQLEDFLDEVELFVEKWGESHGA